MSGSWRWAGACTRVPGDRSPAGEAGCRRGWGTIRRVRFRIEHYRAVDVPGSALGYQFAPTGRVEEVDAHDEEDAAAMALTVAGDEPDADGPVAYDPELAVRGAR